ncbi:unnamed protein product [Sphagnum troendelagicum]
MVSKYNVATMCYGSGADNCHEKEWSGDRDALGLNGELMKKSSRGSEMHDQTTVKGQPDVMTLSSLMFPF